MTGRRSVGAQVVGLAVSLAITFATGAVGAVASVQAASFYAGLQRPPWAPPAGVFGPVWSVLYASMGIAAWWVWRRPGGQPLGLPLGLFAAQLLANALWSWLFFGWHLGAPAFVDVVLLLGLIAATIVAFWRVRPLAGMLLLPYLLWVGFASALTWSVWRANPALL